MIDLSANIAGVAYKSCIMNASGPNCSTRDELVTLGESEAGAIVTKSMTLRPREGNPEPRYFEFELGSVNSMGLPNLGYQAYGELIGELKTFQKPIIASVAGFTESEYVEITSYISGKNPDMIEINLSCPNIPGHPQIGYDFEASHRILGAVRKVSRQPLGVKLPPYLDLVQQEQMAKVIMGNRIDFVVTINSVGNALVIDPEKEQVVIKAKGGLGGLGGECIKPIALANIRVFYELLGKQIPIIGVGGISSGTDIFEHLLAGASAVQVGTAFAREGIGIFSRLKKELTDILEEKNYASVREVTGKLKVME